MRGLFEAQFRRHGCEPPSMFVRVVAKFSEGHVRRHSGFDGVTGLCVRRRTEPRAFFIYASVRSTFELRRCGCMFALLKRAGLAGCTAFSHAFPPSPPQCGTARDNNQYCVHILRGYHGVFVLQLCFVAAFGRLYRCGWLGCLQHVASAFAHALFETCFWIQCCDSSQLSMRGVAELCGCQV